MELIKRLFIAFYAILILATSASAQEPDYPYFVKIYATSDRLADSHYVYGITDKGEVYCLQDSPKKILSGGISDMSYDYYYLQFDGTLTNIDGQILAKQVTSCSGIVFLRGSDAFSFVDGKEIFLCGNVKQIISQGTELKSAYILETDDRLYYFDLDGIKHLISEDVKTFDATFISHSNAKDSVYIIKNDKSLWRFTFHTYDMQNIQSEHIMNGVKRVSVPAQPYSGEVLYITEDGRLYFGSEYIMDDVMEISNDAASVAIKNDGTIWYWGFVPWQPSEHIFTTPGTPIGETQSVPIMLSMDENINVANSRKRMENWLTDENIDSRWNRQKSNRFEALEEYYDYYAENYGYLYTYEELSEFNPHPVYQGETSIKTGTVTQQETTKPIVKFVIGGIFLVAIIAVVLVIRRS